MLRISQNLSKGDGKSPVRAMAPLIRQGQRTHHHTELIASGMESARLNATHQAFLESIGVRPSDLTAQALPVLARLLEKLSETAQKPASAAAKGLHETTVRVAEGDSFIRIQRRVDLASGSLLVTVDLRAAGQAVSRTTRTGGFRLRQGAGPGQAQTSEQEAGGAAQMLRSFMNGALAGDFSEDTSFTALAGQTVIGFIPVVGQIADLRDLAAALRAAADGEPGGMGMVAIAMVGFVPGTDFLKVARKAGKTGRSGGKSGRAARQRTRSPRTKPKQNKAQKRNPKTNPAERRRRRAQAVHAWEEAPRREVWRRLGIRSPEQLEKYIDAIRRKPSFVRHTHNATFYYRKLSRGFIEVIDTPTAANGGTAIYKRRL